MSPFFFDTEFNEYVYKPLIGKPVITIDLISIGIVSLDGREYYAVNKEFNLKAAWNKYEEKLPKSMGDAPVREYWLRDNVLKPLWQDLHSKVSSYEKMHYPSTTDFTYKGLRELIKRYGKTEEAIKQDIFLFINNKADVQDYGFFGKKVTIEMKDLQYPEFWGYYADYDWTVFCQLHGGMLKLMKGYPWYCCDLKQEFDKAGLTPVWKQINCPDPEGEHHALVDARWNRDLYKKMQPYINREKVKYEPEKPIVNMANLSDLSNIPDLTPEEMNRSEKFVPKNLFDAVWYIIDQMSKDNVDYIKSGKISMEDFVTGNHGWAGLQIRNEWCLHWQPNHGLKSWPQEKPLIVSYFNAMGITHADDMSTLVFRTIYKVLRGEQVQFHETISEDQVLWLREQGK